MKAFVRVAVLCVLVAAGSTSCSRTDAVSTLESAASQPNQPKASALGLVDRIHHARLTVAHAGRRLVEYMLPSAGSAATLSYEEDVIADGQGHFSLTPASVRMPAMNANQRDTFDLLQKQREGFFFSYRDFGVRHRQLFAQNYRIVELPTRSTVAGRSCVEIEVRRVDHASTWYLVDVDEESGLVLRHREYTLEGHMLARAEFLDFTTAPQLDGVEWHDSGAEDTRKKLAPGAEAVLGFAPASPSFLPSGFQLLETDVVEADGKSWIRRTYGDGVESLFLLHADAGAAPRTRALVSTPSASGDESVLSATDAPPLLKVRLCQVGPWTLAEANAGLEQIFVVGKLGEADVVRVLQSAL